MNLSALERQIGKVERAAGLGPCAACAICDAFEERVAELYRARFRELYPEAEDNPNPVGPVVTVREVVRCAWCGIREDKEFQMPEGEEARELQAYHDAIEAGRWCSAEVKAALTRYDARRRATLDEEYAARYDELSRQMYADLDRLPPGRFPYVCTVAGCLCRWKRTATRGAGDESRKQDRAA